MADTAQQLARGREITLINGSKVTILFSLYTLAVIEDELGSLDAIDQVFAEGSKGKLIRTLGKLLANSIVGEKWSEDDILRQIALEDVGSVFVQVQEGLQEGFQSPEAAATEKSTPTPDLSTFPGAASSTAGVSPSANAAATSGT